MNQIKFNPSDFQFMKRDIITRKINNLIVADEVPEMEDIATIKEMLSEVIRISTWESVKEDCVTAGKEFDEFILTKIPALKWAFPQSV